MNLNPFSHLIETNSQPYARTLRTSFLTKVADTFKAFSGGNDTQNPNSDYPYRAGIFDYLTLGIFMGINYILHQASERSTSFTSQVTLFALNAICSIPKYIMSFAMTLATLPFIAIAHGISTLFANKYKQAINNHQLSNNDTADIKDSSTKKTFGQLLKDKGCTLENIKSITTQKSYLENNSQSMHIKYRQQAQQSYKDKKMIIHCSTDDKFFTALRSLNVGGIQSNIDNQSGPVLFV